MGTRKYIYQDSNLIVPALLNIFIAGTFVYISEGWKVSCRCLSSGSFVLGSAASMQPNQAFQEVTRFSDFLTSFWVICAEEHAQYFQFIFKPACKDSDTSKLKIAKILLYTLYTVHGQQHKMALSRPTHFYGQGTSNQPTVLHSPHYTYIRCKPRQDRVYCLAQCNGMKFLPKQLSTKWPATQQVQQGYVTYDIDLSKYTGGSYFERKNNECTQICLCLASEPQRNNAKVKQLYMPLSMIRQLSNIKK